MTGPAIGPFHASQHRSDLDLAHRGDRTEVSVEAAVEVLCSCSTDRGDEVGTPRLITFEQAGELIEIKHAAQFFDAVSSLIDRVRRTGSAAAPTTRTLA